MKRKEEERKEKKRKEKKRNNWEKLVCSDRLANTLHSKFPPPRLYTLELRLRRFA